MIKKLYESFEKKLKETTNEKVNLTLESLAELNEEEHDEQVIKDTLYIGPRKYSIEVYPDVENGYIAHWEDDSDNGFGYNNKGWVNLSKNSQMLAFKEKGYADIEDYISVISVYDRPLRPEVKQEIIKKVLTIRGEGQPELTEEDLTEDLDENTKKEVEIELEDILKRNPDKHGFDADTEEIKEYVKVLLKEKGYKVEISGNDNYKPNKYHVEYWKEEKIEEGAKSKGIAEEYISNDVLWDALQEDEFYSFDIDGEEHYIEIYEKNDDSITFNYYPDRGTEPETMSKIDFIEWTTTDKTAEEIKAEYGI